MSITAVCDCIDEHRSPLLHMCCVRPFGVSVGRLGLWDDRNPAVLDVLPLYRPVVVKIDERVSRFALLKPRPAPPGAAHRAATEVRNAEVVDAVEQMDVAR